MPLQICEAYFFMIVIKQASQSKSCPKTVCVFIWVRWPSVRAVWFHFSVHFLFLWQVFSSEKRKLQWQYRNLKGRHWTKYVVLIFSLRGHFSSFAKNTEKHRIWIAGNELVHFQAARASVYQVLMLFFLIKRRSRVIQERFFLSFSHAH